MTDKEKQIKDVYDMFVSKGMVVGYRTKNREEYALVHTRKQSVFGNIQSKGILTALKRLFYEYDSDFIGLDNDFLICMLQMTCYDNQLEHDFVHRIFFDGTKYVYDLDQSDSSVVTIDREEISIATISKVYFKRGVDYKAQVEPDFDSKGSKLYGYIKKHFNIPTKGERLLFMLYLVSCFIPDINCPVLILYGEKGSGKSSCLRKIREVISPSSADLTGMPKTLDDLALRLCNTYYLCLDNCSSVKRDYSDLLARACTGGSYSKRKLYTDSEETMINIKGHVALNSVSALCIKESDLLDRSLILHLSRFDSEEIITEEQMWDEFNEDLPKILGSIFHILSQVLFDEEPVETTKLVRLADWHEKCLKIGRCLGVSEPEVNDAIWSNQHNVNKITLDEDIIAFTVISLLKREGGEYVGSMSQLLKDLNMEARHLAVKGNLLPKSPNHLSSRLKKIQSNLKQEYGIEYEIKNKGAFKEITIVKRKK